MATHSGGVGLSHAGPNAAARFVLCYRQVVAFVGRCRTDRGMKSHLAANPCAAVHVGLLGKHIQVLKVAFRHREGNDPGRFSWVYASWHDRSTHCICYNILSGFFLKNRPFPAAYQPPTASAEPGEGNKGAGWRSHRKRRLGAAGFRGERLFFCLIVVTIIHD